VIDESEMMTNMIDSVDYPREKIMEYGLHVTGIQEISMKEGKFGLYSKDSQYPVTSVCRVCSAPTHPCEC
jgi:hypothetical protein